MTNEQALQAIKDLIEYLKTNPVSELQVVECDAPLAGEGVKIKKYTKVEYFIRTVETVVYPDNIDKNIVEIDTQIGTLTAQKDEIVSIGAQIAVQAL